MADVTGFLEQAGVDFDVLEHAHTQSGRRTRPPRSASGPRRWRRRSLWSRRAATRAPCSPPRKGSTCTKSPPCSGSAERRCTLASEDDLARSYPDFELGAVPPFGGREDQVIVDERLAGRDSVVLEAGSHDRSVRLKAADLVHLTRAQVADICREEPTAG
jgi:hypothetical protein